MTLYVGGGSHLPVQCDGDLSCEQPWQSVIVPPSHQVGIHWDTSACTITSSIGIYLDTHLVTSRVGAEWRTVPFLFRCYVLGEINTQGPAMILPSCCIRVRVYLVPPSSSLTAISFHCSLTVSMARWRWDASFSCCCTSLWGNLLLKPIPAYLHDIVSYRHFDWKDHSEALRPYSCSGAMKRNCSCSTWSICMDTLHHVHSYM